MKKQILAATAACGLAITAVPALADHHMEGDGMTMTATQKAMYDSWSAENQMTYDAWPMEAQTYYWTLNDNQKKIWWDKLTDDQRVKIVAMTPEQQTTAWTSINAQLNGTATATTTATTSSAAKINYSSNPVVQPTPGDAGPPPAKLPICEPEQQDNCINRGAA